MKRKGLDWTDLVHADGGHFAEICRLVSSEGDLYQTDVDGLYSGSC